MTKNISSSLPPGVDQVEETRRVMREMEDQTNACIDRQTAPRPAGTRVQVPRGGRIRPD